MEVYEFDKCLLTRLNESQTILAFKDQPIPASQVRAEWSYFAEVQVEPTGWQALWKIPRMTCEELGIRYPTVVFGNVEQVMFKELKAIFTVLCVEEDDVHIPEQHEVELEELWPTIKQENKELNVEKTADVIDMLRFFYNNVWMPWDKDNDDDLDWADKHLESRIRFFYDLKRKGMKRSLAAHIRSLLVESRYLQKRREFYEMDMSDDDELDVTVDKNRITDLMALHLRLARIKSEIEMFENPEIRKIYEDFEENNSNSVKDILHTSQQRRSITKIEKMSCFVVTRPNVLQQQIGMFELAKKYIPEQSIVQISPSLHNALERCNASDKIYLPPGLHYLKFLEYLNDNGLICGLSKATKQTAAMKDPSEAIVVSEDEDSTLMVFDGDFTLENLTLDCRNVRNGIIVKSGNLVLKNCRVVGDGKSSIHEGISVSGNSTVTIDGTCINGFATGIILSGNAKAFINSAIICDCNVAIETEEGATLEFSKTKICNSKNCGILISCRSLDNNNDQKKIIYQSINELKPYSDRLAIDGECDFDKNLLGNIVVQNKGLVNSLMDTEESVDTDYMD